jgi:hypothetical protein
MDFDTWWWEQDKNHNMPHWMRCVDLIKAMAQYAYEAGFEQRKQADILKEKPFFERLDELDKIIEEGEKDCKEYKICNYCGKRHADHYKCWLNYNARVRDDDEPVERDKWEADEHRHECPYCFGEIRVLLYKYQDIVKEVKIERTN